MQITFNIPDDKVQDFKTGFLKSNPNPPKSEMNDFQWIKHTILGMIISEYQRGAKVMHQEAHPYTPEELIVGE